MDGSERKIRSLYANPLKSSDAFPEYLGSISVLPSGKNGSEWIDSYVNESCVDGYGLTVILRG
jgi:hypothetical protein